MTDPDTSPAAVEALAKDVKRINRRLHAAAATLRAQAEEIEKLRELKKEAFFLVARLNEFEGTCVMDEEGAREWSGHVEPSLERMHIALAALTQPQKR